MASAAYHPGDGVRGPWAGKTLVYGFLVLFALYYLVPLAVVFLNSFRDLQEITRGSLIGIPQSISLSYWGQAWDEICVGGICEGIQPYFWSSFKMVVPATIISTALGALNGYALSKWRFRGSEVLFGAITLGVFIPGQMVLLPWAITLGKLGLTNTTSGPRADPRRAGPELHDAVLPQLLRQHPGGPDQGRAHRRRRLLPDLLAHRPAAVAADPDRHGDLAVHQHLERVPVRGDLRVGRQPADHGGPDRALGHGHDRPASTTSRALP